jgi:glucosamine--fructose-6-phosphate aminotransferase (isomerizing)
MCGIIGYIGESKDVVDHLYSGLKKLEYRGYDSCGAAVVVDNDILFWHHLGAPSEVEGLKKPNSNIGIGHTRWATHGEVSIENAHPHHSCDKEVFLVHNGVIENSDEIRKTLEHEKCSFYSETDSEALANLIAFHYKESGDAAHALRTALADTEGTYGLAVLFRGDNKIYAARRSSPLILGLGDNEHFLVSDVIALPANVNKVVYLNDGDIAVLERDAFSVYDSSMSHKRSLKQPSILKKAKSPSLGNHSCFMEKEIFEQPKSIRETTSGRFTKDFSSVVLGGVNLNKDIKRVLFLGCGTAYHAGLLGKYYIENIAKIPATVEISSEYKYKNNPTEDGTLVVAISQSGETFDTIGALETAQEKGLDTIAITNTVMSSIARQVPEGIYQRVGPEVSVASTKAFTSQAVLTLMLAISLGRRDNLSLLDSKKYIDSVRRLPELVEQCIASVKEECRGLAIQFGMCDNVSFLGRQYMYPLALEGALKLKELSYVHTHGYATGEMKHGPLAAIGHAHPCIFVAPEKSLKEKNISSLKEVCARGGLTALIKQKGQEFPRECYLRAVEIPKAPEYILPILSAIPLQLFAMYMAQNKKLDVDRPRHLAKSVTVE